MKDVNSTAMGKMSRQNRRSKESLSKAPAWRDSGRLPTDARLPDLLPQAPAVPPAPAAAPSDATGLALRAQAVHTARQIIAARLGLIDGVRALHEQLTKLGAFEGGEFSGDFAALSFFAFETDPYPSEAQRQTWSAAALSEADRWVPTLISTHRAKVLAACQRVIDKHG